MDAADHLIALLTLLPAAAVDGAQSFLGHSLLDRPRVFGGQFLAQGLIAAAATVSTPGRLPHSLRASFLRPGDPQENILYRVEVLRDGRSFSSRQVTAYQRNVRCYEATMSFCDGEGGLDYQLAAGDAMPTPPECHVEYADWVLDTTSDAAFRTQLRGRIRPIEMRYVNPPPNPADGPITETQRMWLRVAGALPDDPLLHLAAIAYASDETLVDNALLPHGMRWFDSRVQGASLDHAMWFCRPARADHWMLYDQTVVSTFGGRGLVQGDLRTEAGELVAITTQEGLIRVT